MQKKIFTRLLGISIVSALFMAVLIIGVLYYSFEQQLYVQLRQDAISLSSVLDLEENDKELLEGMPLPNRLTLVASDGTVLFDNQSTPNLMDNHLERQEIQEALARGVGYAKRKSSTLFEEQLYCAFRMQNGNFIRVSASQKTIGGLVGQIAGFAILGFAGVLALAAVLAKHLTRKLIAPINALNLENPLSNEVYDEFSPMLRRMAEQNQRIASQMKELSARREELDTLIGSMREGLLILDNKLRILTINQRAADILQIDRVSADGKPLISFNRSEVLRRVIAEANDKGTAQVEMESFGRSYIASASVIGKREGITLLLQDSTAAHEAERDRKRFTANVSHELRTPLTTISGYAELMANQMVEAEDIPDFSQKIFKESQRLLHLIEDILHLSKLDEGHIQGKREPVNLLSAANNAQESLAGLGKDAQIKLQVSGEPLMIHGDPVLLEEMLRNLMENGIKYNRPGGYVNVRIHKEDSVCVVTVEDNGIGIPKERQSKVFERFYRVDTSRSQATGGTGLGLSIVKHGAEYHHASVALQSAEDGGTTVVIRFPLEKIAGEN